MLSFVKNRHIISSINVEKKEEKMEEKLICALLFGEATTEKRIKQIAESYQNCSYVSLMATKENQLFATLFLPEKQRWWIEYIEKKPRETFRLEKAKVTIADNVNYPRQLKMRLPEKPQKISPCGANCETCTAYEKCLCCPATIFYKKSKA
jgi:hypothetical protein